MTDEIPTRLRIAIGQLNPVVGDVSGNLELALEAWSKAHADGADLLVLSELFLSGYPPEDLVLKPSFQQACRHAAESLAEQTVNAPAIIIGSPWRDGEKLHNSVLLLDGGEVRAVRHKVELPNYGVFDERRVFQPGPMPGPVDFRGLRIGIPICEDIWIEDVAECLLETGAELLISPNGSPYWQNKADERVQVVVSRIVETGLPIIYVNQFGGQDELVFDGGSFAIHADRTLAFQMPQFEAAIVLCDWSKDESGAWRCVSGPKSELPARDEANWLACVIGLRDYVNKNRFPSVVLGLSGGIDSAICAAMSVDALGADRVHCIMLPYRYTSELSLKDAADCADALGVEYDVVPIADAVEAFSTMLEPLFAGRSADVTEENIQSRVRGTALMAVSNKFGSMVVTTGNKSEVSVGYATLYGDMNGGFNPVKDLYKTEVYRLSAWRNSNHLPAFMGPKGEVIPTSIIDKVPTAELREGQTDQDSLPPYDDLDAILNALVEDEKSVGEIVAMGYEEPVVRRVEHLLYIAEYKRRQSAPGIKITRRNFGRDRRYPITNRYRDA
ncbi:MAG TPA: NAD+ synthase [Afifellaceae bacterium]|nr:NAD+ synthase [Afifellaceae bacterium]